MGHHRVKSASAFRTISEVAADLDVPQHVLRFWESKFRQVRPMKRAGGRRYYRPEDVDLLRRIRFLLYDEGYTIRGVQRLLRDNGVKATVEEGRATAPASPVAPPAARDGGSGLDEATRRTLQEALDELTALRDLLRQHKK